MLFETSVLPPVYFIIVVFGGLWMCPYQCFSSGHVCACTHCSAHHGAFSEHTDLTPGGQNEAKIWAVRTQEREPDCWDELRLWARLEPPMSACCGCSQDQILLQTDLLMSLLLFSNSGKTCKANLKAPVLCRGCELPANYSECIVPGRILRHPGYIYIGNSVQVCRLK